MVTGLAVGTLLLAGCTSGAEPSTTQPPAASPASPSPVPPARVPDPGWADDVVAAGDGAYVVGWRADGAGALWWVDAGGRLRPRATPPGMPGDPRTARADATLRLAAAGPDLALAVTGSPGGVLVSVTDDGARTWRRVVLPPGQHPERTAVGGGTAYLLTGDCSGAEVTCRHATVWSVDPADGSARRVARLAAGASDTGGTDLAAYGAPVWALLDTDGPSPTALRSVDGGRTWRPNAAPPCLSLDLTPTSGHVLWTTCGTGMLVHFTRQVGDGAPAPAFDAGGPGTSDAALLPLTDTTAYAVVPDRGSRTSGERLVVTRDGGVTTTTVAPVPRGLTRRGFRVAFVSAAVGYLVTEDGGEVYRTADGGRRWSRIPDPT